MSNMTTYIGTKIIEARPMTRGAYNEYRGWTIPAGENPADEGYLVKYTDNYVSWSPKDVFEAAYMPVIANPNLKTDKPSISQEMVDDFIQGTLTTTMGEKTTVVRAMLRNGFEIVESSACVSKENYDEKLGYDICMKKIKDKVWYLLGFLLQTAVHGIGQVHPVPKADGGDRGYMNFGRAIEAAKKGHKIARQNWNGKGQYVFLARDVEFTTDANLSAFQDKDVNVTNMLVIKTAQDIFQPGWLATQSDILANDWYIVE